METFGVFDGGEGGDGAQRGQFVQQTTNRSSAVAVRSDQPRGPRPASQMAYRPPNAERQNEKQVSVRDVGDRSLLGSNASANFETYHDTIATRARVWAGQGPDPFSKSGKKDPNRPIMVTEVKSFLYAFCGRQRSLPEYETKPAGRDKNGWMSYFSTVAPTGFPYVGQGTAQTRKEAQTAAAWDFIDYLVKQAIVSDMDLPLREEKYKHQHCENYNVFVGPKPGAEPITRKKIAKTMAFVGGTRLKETHGADITTGFEEERFADAETPSGDGKKGPVKVKQTVIVELNPANMDAKPQKKQRPKSLYEQAKENEIVGSEYIEVVPAQGRQPAKYRCRLCDCEFNDETAKDMHIKGKRHKLTFKTKVDPEYDVKCSFKLIQSMKLKMWQQRVPQMIAEKEERMERRDRASDMRNLRIWDGKHIESKLKQIVPKLMEENEIKDAVERVEKGVKKVSDETMVNGQRTLRGVVRVGPAAKGMLLASERQCHLVTLTHEAPTNQFLEDIAEKLGPHLGDGYRIDLLPDEGGFGLTSPTDVEIVVRLACPAVRPENRKDDEPEPELSDESLDIEPQLAALAELRRSKWFATRATANHRPVLRIMRDLCARVETWAPLAGWPLEVIICGCLETPFERPPFSTAEGFRRVFECIAAGLLLPGSSGLKDPVEKETINVLDCLELQEAEDITASAQHALRLMAYRKIYKILGVAEINNLQLEPERGMDMIEGEPERKRLALMGATAGALGVVAPPGAM